MPSSPPAERPPSNSVRVSIDLSPNQHDLLERVAAELNETKASVMRRALDVMGYASEAKRLGRRLCVCDGERSVVAIAGV